MCAALSNRVNTYDALIGIGRPITRYHRVCPLRNSGGEMLKNIYEMCVIWRLTSYAPCSIIALLRGPGRSSGLAAAA